MSGPGYAQPLSQGYPQPGPLQPGYGQPTAVTQQPVAMGETPVPMTCTSCRNQIVTSTTRETGKMTYVACVVLCLCGCDLGCCLIPFCIDSCKDTVHHCPTCKTTLGRKNKM